MNQIVQSHGETQIHIGVIWQMFLFRLVNTYLA